MLEHLAEEFEGSCVNREIRFRQGTADAQSRYRSDARPESCSRTSDYSRASYLQLVLASTSQSSSSATAKRAPPGCLQQHCPAVSRTDWPGPQVRPAVTRTAGVRQGDTMRSPQASTSAPADAGVALDSRLRALTRI